MTNNLTIGYTCNVRPPELDGDPKYGEWESHETIEAIIQSFEKTGNKVILIDADKDVYHKLLRYDREIDIVFNNAEGLSETNIREAIVPFFCEVLQIPYTGSGPQTLINGLDKPTTKEILRNYGINTALFQKMESYADRLEKSLHFPLMVKPTSEGTSIGITQKSKVENDKELEKAVRKVIRECRQPALVEEYISGDEYTVGIIGNYVLPIIKIRFEEIPGNPIIRDPHIKEIENPYITLMSQEEKGYFDLGRQTVIAFEALCCNDYCRIDFRRKGIDGKFYFLEMNPLPGLSPIGSGPVSKESDLPHMTRHAGIEYYETINWIMWEAIKRLRKDKNYVDRFTESKIEGVSSCARFVKNKIKLYNKSDTSNLNEEDYRMVQSVR